VFLEELGRGNLPNYAGVVERGLFFPSAVVGGHFQRTSNLSEITGRPFTSGAHPRENLLNAARDSGAVVGVVNDFVITLGAKYLQEKGRIASVEEVYPRLIDRPRLENLGYPKFEFLPDLEPPRWLYWYRDRATHRHFHNFALGFNGDGGLLEDIVAENPSFVRDQQRYSLRLQDRWFGATLAWLEARGVLDETVVVVFSSHGTSLEGWLPLMKQITRGNVDHASCNFHPNVSRSFAVLAGPGVDTGVRDEWISIMDLKPTLCRLLGITDLGESAYGVDLLNGPARRDRVLADVTSERHYSLFDTATDWLYMSVLRDDEVDARPHLAGLPTSSDGSVAFHLADDPSCAEPRTEEFGRSSSRERLGKEARRLGLQVRPVLAGDHAGDEDPSAPPTVADLHAPLK
jgi:arylsulfatase A-like enzyme